MFQIFVEFGLKGLILENLDLSQSPGGYPNDFPYTL